MSDAVKLFIGGYLISNLMDIDMTYQYLSPPRNLFTEYDTLANYVEYDRLQQLGIEPHLMAMFQRGKKKGLSQVDLFELTKHLELDFAAKPMAYHVDYLRDLKS